MANNEILLKLKAISDFSDVQGNVKTLQKYLTNLKLPNSITKNLGKEFDELDKELQKFQSHINSGFKSKSDITGLEKSGKKIAQLFSNIENAIEGIDTTDLKKAFQIDVSELKEANKLVDSLKGELAGKIKSEFTVKINGEEKVVKLNESVEKLFKNSSAKQRLINFKNAIDTGDIESAKKQLEDLQTYANKMFGETSVKGNAFKVALLEIKAILDDKTMGDPFSDLANRIKEAQEVADKTKASFDDMRESATTALVGGIKEMSQGLGEYRKEVESSAQSQQKLNSEIGQIKDQVSHYFSLINAAQLLRRAFQDVYNTVKELDAVMTETAVVTDFSVGDMWDKLPEYTAQAKALGVATKELYASTTLYYQQGLDTNASMAAGIETMKMAKIAGMEAADATDAMTAALRGFNMEVNETNAQRVNDVYSKLAAITASDTEEIATAMSKTASIASAVGAEFENIAVFLAQGIETTRESADSIGTALKTVLARFNELTKDPAEIGEIDGEIVDANKVEKALRSVGIALTDTNGQFREADKVLLEVAQKWDTMSVMQQRYIATQAAGSRQQSRFIAMMSDYNRTMELQAAAYNAEGAAQAQYEKTLESLESKLNKLKDTWDEFILGIANSDVIKGAVDFLSDLLDVINKMTNAPGILGGVLKSLLAIGVFKGGKVLIGKGGLGERLFDASQIAKEAAKKGMSASEAFREEFEKSSKKNGKNMLQSIISIFKKDTWKVPMPKIDMKGEYSKEIKNLQNQLNNSIEFQLDDWEIDAKTDKIQHLTNAISDNNNIKEIQKQVNRATQSQINAYNAAVANGVSVEEASILLTKKGTLEEYKAVAAKKLGAQATEEQKEELAKKMMAEAASNTVTKMGILTQARYLLQMVFGTQAARESAAAKLAEAGSTWTAKIAQDALNSSLLACPIGWIVAGIAALVTGLVLLAKWAKTQTLEYKMEQAAETTKRAESAAKAAKDAYEDLVSSKEEFDEFQSTLEDLTYGTLEWKKALVDANQQVLKLLKTYPTLANYISENDQGVLTISEEGWNTILEKQIQNVETSQSALTVSQYQEHQLSRPKVEKAIFENISTEDEPSFWDKFATSILQQEAKRIANDVAFAEALISNNVISSTNQALVTDEKLKNNVSIDINAELLKAMEQGQTITDTRSAIYGELMEKTGLGSDKILEYAEALMTTQTEIQEFANQSTIYAQQIGSSTKEIANLEEGEDLAWILGQRFTEEYDEIAASITVPSTYEEAAQEYADALGVSTDYIKEQYKDDADGIEKLKKDLKNFRVSEEINKRSKEFAKAWANFGNEAQEKVSALLSQGGKSLTQDQIDAFSNSEDKIGYLKSLGISEENIKLFGYDTIDAMIKAIEDNITTATVAFDVSKENFSTLMKGVESSWGGGIWKDLMGQMTSGAAKDFNNILSSIMIDMGAQGVDSYLTLVDSLSNKLTEGGKKKLLDNLSLIDLQDIENAEDLREALDSIGISAIELTDEELKDLNEEIQAMAATASRTIVDISKAQKAISAGVSSEKILKEAIEDNNFEFSEEDYETLLAAGASSSDFFYDGETYAYLGDTVDLLQQIRDDTNAMRAKLLAQIEQDTMEGATIADWIAGGEVYNNGQKVSRESLIISALNDNPVEGFDAKQILQKLAASSLTGDALKEAYQKIFAMTEDAAKVYLGQIYNDKYGTGGTIYSENLTTYEQTLNKEAGATAAKQSAIGNAQLYKQATEQYQKYQDKVNKGIPLTNKETLAMEKAEAQMKNNISALKKKAKVLGMTEEEVEDYIGNNQTGVLGQIIAEKQLETNLLNASSALEDYFEILSSNNSSDLEKDNALSGIIQAADYYLGLELDKEFLKDAENLKAFKAAINGTKEDFYSFLNTLDGETRNRMLGIATTVEDATQAFHDASLDVKVDTEFIKDMIDTLNGDEFIINGKGDFTDLYNKLLTAGYTAEDVMLYLQELAGSGVEFEVTTQEIWVPIKELNGRETVPLNGTMSDLRKYDQGFRKIAVPKSIVGTYVGTTREAPSTNTNDEETGSGGSSDKYESNTDKFHNTQQKIQSEQRKRNKLEEDYADLLEDENASLDDILEKSQEIVNSAEKENNLHKDIIAGRRKDIANEFATSGVLSKYAYYDSTTDTIQYKKDANGNNLIDSVTDPETGEAFDKGWENVNNWLDDIHDREDTIEDNEEIIAQHREAGTNELDKSFNILEKIEQTEKKISKYEAERELLLENAAENAEEILQNYEDQKDALEDQVGYWEQLKKEREEQHNQNLEDAKAGGWMKYIVVLEDGTFQVNEDALEGANQDIQDKVAEWIDTLNESGDALDEATEGYLTAAKDLKDYRKELKETGLEFFNEVKDALVADWQEQIDQMSAENEAINKATSELFDSVSKSLSEQRQQRDNEETEQDIADMEARLAYLRSDTTGANDLEIKNLEKQLEEKKEDYTDTLIDQKISELQEQNDEAAAQRDVQIGLAQAQLDWAQKSGEINEQAWELVSSGLDKNGNIIEGSTLQKLLGKDTQGMVGIEQQGFWNEKNAGGQALRSFINGYLGVGQEDSSYKTGENVTSKTNLPKGYKATVVEGGIKVTKPDGKSFTVKGVTEDLLGKMDFSQATNMTGIFTAADARKALRIAASLDKPTEEEKVKYDIDNDGKITASDARAILRNAAQLDNIDFGEDKYSGKDFFDAVDLMNNKGYNKIYDLNKNGKIDNSDLDLIIKNFGLKKYKTGGLADFTGPAWLDGTKSKPEMVLNAQDTQNFIQLKDILSQVLKGVGTANTDGKTGDTYYEIHIDVEKMASDYDVDDVAERVKTIITQDAMYRNNNTINRLR